VHALSLGAAVPMRSEGGLPEYDQSSFPALVHSHIEHHRTSHAGKDERVCEAKFRAFVSKGTYIRSLARDIANALGTVGHVSYLRRTRAGPFSLATAISLDFLEEAAKARALTRTVLPLTAALDDIPALPVTPDQAQLLRHGQKLAGFPAKPGLQLATSDAVPVALVEAAADGLKVVRGFNL
jgi:tRNA pseudouridine55 synthase